MARNPSSTAPRNKDEVRGRAKGKANLYPARRFSGPPKARVKVRRQLIPGPDPIGGLRPGSRVPETDVRRQPPPLPRLALPALEVSELRQGSPVAQIEPAAVPSSRGIPLNTGLP